MKITIYITGNSWVSMVMAARPIRACVVCGSLCAVANKHGEGSHMANET